MNSAVLLYRLQQIDNQIQQKRQYSDEINRQLEANPELASAESALSNQDQLLEAAKKSQKKIEWDLEDMTTREQTINSKLYNGQVSNPKELLGLKNESESLKARISTKEDELLTLMGEVESLDMDRGKISQKVTLLRRTWEETKSRLLHKSDEITTDVDKLLIEKDELERRINPNDLTLYKELRKTRGNAVAIIQQGQCQGCFMSLPIGQWQKVKSGSMVQCSNCGRILYLE